MLSNSSDESFDLYSDPSYSTTPPPPPLLPLASSSILPVSSPSSSLTPYVSLPLPNGFASSSSSTENSDELSPPHKRTKIKQETSSPSPLDRSCRSSYVSPVALSPSATPLESTYLNHLPPRPVSHLIQQDAYAFRLQHIKSSSSSSSSSSFSSFSSLASSSSSVPSFPSFRRLRVFDADLHNQLLKEMEVVFKSCTAEPLQTLVSSETKKEEVSERMETVEQAH